MFRFPRFFVIVNKGGASRPKPGSFGVFRSSRVAGEFDLSKEGTGYEHFQ
jgi:hypothetical protein